MTALQSPTTSNFSVTLSQGIILTVLDEDHIWVSIPYALAREMSWQPKDPIEVEWTLLAAELAVYGVEALDPDEADTEYHDDFVKIWCAYINGQEPA